MNRPTSHLLGIFSRIGAGLCALTALAFLSCVGGTGTDTENGITGRTLGTDGQPVAMTVRMLPLDYVPVSEPQNQILLGEAQIQLTNSRGEFHFNVGDTGIYILEGMEKDSSRFFLSVHVKDVGKLIALADITAQETALFRGNINLKSGYRIESGFIFVKGTLHKQPVDTAGGYNLGVLPKIVPALGLNFKSSPRTVKLITTGIEAAPSVPVTHSQSGDKAFYTCKDIQADSVPAPSDSGSGSTHAAADSAYLKDAMTSCDSLKAGDNLIYRANESGSAPRTDSSGSAFSPVRFDFIVVEDTLGSKSTSEKKVIPAQCVESTNGTITTYDLAIKDGSGDIVVDDLSDDAACTAP